MSSDGVFGRPYASKALKDRRAKTLRDGKMMQDGHFTSLRQGVAQRQAAELPHDVISGESPTGGKCGKWTATFRRQREQDPVQVQAR